MDSTRTRELWRVSKRATLDLAVPRVMAILNFTPDSFADGGRLQTPQSALDAADHAIESGAAMLDIGGESTRPGAARVSTAEQIERVVPAIHAIRARHATIPISIDTTLSAVAAAALDAGADAVNDVSGGTEDAAMLPLVANRGAGVILMHRLAPPEKDSYSDRYVRNPQYRDVLVTVREFLTLRMDAARSAGIEAESIMLDPGLGFGKDVSQNLELIHGTQTLASLGRPILSAVSRKSFVGRLGLGRDSKPEERLASTLALSVLHFEAGARLFRVHDVREHVEVLNVALAMHQARERAAPPQRID